MVANPEVMLRGRRRLLEEHGESLPRSYLAHTHYEIGHALARLDDFESARSKFRTAVRMNPRAKGYYYYSFWLLFGSIGYTIGQWGHRRLHDRISSLVDV